MKYPCDAEGFVIFKVVYRPSMRVHRSLRSPSHGLFPAQVSPPAVPPVFPGKTFFAVTRASKIMQARRCRPASPTRRELLSRWWFGQFFLQKNIAQKRTRNKKVSCHHASAAWCRHVQAKDIPNNKACHSSTFIRLPGPSFTVSFGGPTTTVSWRAVS